MRGKKSTEVKESGPGKSKDPQLATKPEVGNREYRAAG